MIRQRRSVWLSHLAQALALIGHNKFTLRTSTEARLAPGFPVLYSYGKYKCTAASLEIVKKKKLVKMMKIMKQVKTIKLVIISLRIVSESLGELKSILG